MLAIKTTDHEAVAKAIQKAIPGAKLIEGSRAGGIAVAWRAGRSVLADGDEDLAKSLSKTLTTICVFAMEYRGTAGSGELHVFDRGKCVRSITCTEDGTVFKGKRFAFEAEVFDVDADDPEPFYSLDSDRVEEFCAELGITVKLDERAPVWTIVDR